MQGEELFVIVIMLIGGFILLYPLARALAERLRPRGADRDQTALDAARDVREELGGRLQQVEREVGELQDRLDFAERLLAKQRADMLPKPGA